MDNGRCRFSYVWACSKLLRAELRRLDLRGATRDRVAVSSHMLDLSLILVAIHTARSRDSACGQPSGFRALEVLPFVKRLDMPTAEGDSISQSEGKALKGRALVR